MDKLVFNSFILALICTAMLVYTIVKAEVRVEVNTSTFMTTIYNNDTVVSQQRTIVGKQGRETPHMQDIITHIVLNPSWTVPKRIVRLDLIPKFKRDPGAYNRYGFRLLNHNHTEEYDVPNSWDKLVDYTLVQPPGPGNILGPIKFRMTNNKFIYIHGTNQPHLFNKPVRKFSSGCIRIEDPIELAELILPHANVQKYIGSGKNQQWIELPKPVNVAIH